MCRFDPKVDLAFKKLFGSEENKDVLISLINSFLPEKEQMTEITLENPYNLPDYINGKMSILDIKAKDEKGTWYDVEMQVGEQGFFGKRALFYWAKMYAEQIKKGKMFSKLRKTIMISILDFEYYKDGNKNKRRKKKNNTDSDVQIRYHRRIGLKDLDTNEEYKQLNFLELIFIELPKFKKELVSLETDLERWITFFNHSSEYEKGKIPEELSMNPAIAKAIKQLDILYFDEKEQEIYEGEQKLILDNIEKMRTAKAKGLEEGMEKERIIQEKKRKEDKIKTAKSLLENSIDINVIITSTGLSKEEIEKLK